MRRLSVETATAKKTRNSVADLRIDVGFLGVEQRQRGKDERGRPGFHPGRDVFVGTQTGENP
jgi:hypothetical protein